MSEHEELASNLYLHTFQLQYKQTLAQEQSKTSDSNLQSTAWWPE